MLIFLSVRSHSDDFLGIGATQVAKFLGFSRLHGWQETCCFLIDGNASSNSISKGDTTMSAPHKRTVITGGSVAVTEATIWNVKKRFGFVADSNAIMAAQHARPSGE
jgi:hypothetical protein